ncbi:MAG: DUF1501 domain-containing protein, partial [Planctomycetia bacterium]|nr:DUF1501 domain-containing protein [Planctomycetia bacterium]
MNQASQNYGSPILSRRQMLQRSCLGFGSLALTALLADEGRLSADDATGDGTLDAKSLQGKAKNVIFLFMGGGPSHVDTWDPKPELAKLDKKDVPESIARDVPKIARSPLKGLFASPYKFAKHGESGLEVSELFPELAKRVDDL